jgi:ATP-dependent protease ClpP protease subunit
MMVHQTLEIKHGSIEVMQKEMEALKKRDKKRLDSMKLEIKRAKETEEPEGA